MSNNRRKKTKYTSSELLDSLVDTIKVDKELVNEHITELSNIISQDTTGNGYRMLGNTLVKCLEDSQKINDQMIKAVSAIQRNEEFDQSYEEEEEDEDMDSLLERISKEKEDGQRDPE